MPPRSSFTAWLLALVVLLLAAGTAVAQTPAGSAEDAAATAEETLDEEPMEAAVEDAVEGTKKELRDVEEIRVTGKATSGTTQAVPDAITSFDQQQLDVMGIANVDSLALNTPALHVGQFGAKAMITLRGVGVENITEVGDPAVGFEVDGIHMGRPISANQTFFDLDRIDVLRGPQGARGGRQTNGGRIALTSKKPTDEVDAFGDFQIGSYDQFLTRAAFNVPILDERLMSRLSVVHEKRDGYQEWKFTGRRSDDTDDADSLLARFQLRSLLFDDSVDLLWIGNYSFQKGNGPARNLLTPPAISAGRYPLQAIFGGVDVSHYSVPCPPGSWAILAPGAAPTVIPAGAPVSSLVCSTADPRETYSDEPSIQDNHQAGFTGQIGWDMPFFNGNAFLSDMRVKVVGGYYDTVQSESFDVDQTNGPSSYFERRTQARQGSIEAFIERPDVENFDFKTGVFYFHETVGTNFCFDASGTGPNADLGADQELMNETIAPYLNAGYRLVDSLRIKAGVRYSLEKKTADQTNQRFLLRFQTPPPGLTKIPLTSGCGMKYLELFNWVGSPTLPASQEVFYTLDSNFSDEEWSRVLPTAGFDWEITESSTLGFNFSTSFKAGGFPLGFDPLLTNASLRLAYPAEEVKSYELSLKNELFDDRVQANLSLFWTDYDPFQICQLAGALYFCEGDGSATSRGIELELVLTPIDNLTINGHFNYLDARIDRFSIVDPAVRNANGTWPVDQKPVDVSGNRLPKSPEFAGSLGVQYAIGLGRWGTVTPRAQAQAQSRTYFRVFNRPDYSQDPFGKLDLSLDWVSEDDRFTVRAFVNNVTDEDVLNFLFVGAAALGGTVSGQYMPPRTFGLRVGVNYTSDLF